MTCSKLPVDSNSRNLAVFRAVLFVLTFTPLGCNKEDETANQAISSNSGAPAATAPSGSAPVNQPLNDLESLVAPIALYPDPLLAELLVAATYPLEIVEAARWLDTKPDLSTLSSKDWDASIMRLTSVPLVIKMMNDHLEWTTQLGNAFLAKPDEVMNAIQALRKRAMDGGFLKSTPEQEVNSKTVELEPPPEASGAVVTSTPTQKEVITIEPAQADTVYVPQYNPETVYQAPMAPAPGSTVVNVNSAAPASSSYYPTYYPSTTTTTTNDSWVNFATGALVGGLLTWGIMEWRYGGYGYGGYGYPPYVGHYYGNSVCHHGNCWYGGGGYYGGGYYGDRGNINYNRNVNISGNQINVDRRGYFKQTDLRRSKSLTGWQPDSRHRRGVAYPKDVQQRLGHIQQPALAGQRLGAAQALPASSRGFTDRKGSLAGGAGQHRLSSADVRQQLQKSNVQGKLGKNDLKGGNVQDRLGRTQKGNNAFQGLNGSGRTSRTQSERGAASRKTIGMNQPKTGSKGGQFGGSERRQQQLATQRRKETAKPNAFETHNASNTRNSSQRGAFSTQRARSGGNFRTSGREAFRGGGGGGHRR